MKQETYKIVFNYGKSDSVIVESGLSALQATFMVAVKNGSTDELFCKHIGDNFVIIGEESGSLIWCGDVKKPSNFAYVVQEENDNLDVENIQYYSNFEKAYLSFAKYLNPARYKLGGSFAVACKDSSTSCLKFELQYSLESCQSMFIYLALHDQIYLRVEEDKTILEKEAKEKFGAFGALVKPTITNFRIYRIELQ